MLALLNLKNTINFSIEREQDFIDKAIASWSIYDLAYHSGQIDAYNNIVKEINFILDN